MLLKTLKFIEKHSLFNKETKILLAISGGMDSMALFHMLFNENFNISVAHVNYQLRGNDADDDASFISQICDDRGIKYHQKTYDTKAYCLLYKKGVQEAARILRYNWFDELIKADDYKFIVTAHHLNDNLETSIHHFARGSGLKGIKSMLPLNGHVVRPLLNNSRNEIFNYIQKNKIDFREDNSNATRNYTRNKIRHDVILPLQKIYPSLDQTSKTSLSILRQTWSFYDDMIQQEKSILTHVVNNNLYINKAKLIAHPHAKLILYEILSDYKFHPDVIDQIYDKAKISSGQIFHSKNYQLTIERDEIVASKPPNEELGIIIITGSGIYGNSQGELHLDQTTEINKPRDSNEWILANIKPSDFPLTLRRWKDGDKFKPKGMKGASKKVKKYLTDIKLSHRKKQNHNVLTNNLDEIIWVVGLRQDIRFSHPKDHQNAYNLRWTTSH